MLRKEVGKVVNNYEEIILTVDKSLDNNRNEVKELYSS